MSSEGFFAGEDASAMRFAIDLRHRSTSAPDNSASPAVNVARRVFTQSKFNELYCVPGDDDAKNQQSCCSRFGALVKVKAKECLPASFSAFLLRLFPFISIMSKYDWRQDSIRDLIAGATVAFLHVPQAMAYGQLATLRPIHGLYVAFFPGLIYFFLGTSRQLSIGVFAVVSLMVAKVLDAEIASASYGLPVDAIGIRSNLSAENATGLMLMSDNSSAVSPEDEELKLRIEIATSYNLIIGLMQLALGIVGAGFVTDYLNEPFISGYTTACACQVFTSQLWLAIGLKAVRHSGPFKIILTLRDFFIRLPTAHWITFGIFLTALAILIVWKEVLEPLVKRKFTIPIPVELILIIIGDGVSYGFGLSQNYKVPIVGPIPSDFPVPTVPKHFRPNYLVDSIPVVLVSFSICISMGKMLGKKYRYSIHPNQEFLALGIGNIFGSFFTCYTASTAMSRTLVMSNVGGRTQVASLISSAIILVVILFVGTFLEPLPTSILAAVVIVNLKGMFIQVFDVRRFWRLCKLDAVIWLVAFLVTVLVDVDIGLYVGVAFVLVTVVFKTAQSHFAVQHQVLYTELFANVEKSRNLAATHPATVLRWSSPIYFANVEQLGDAIRKGINPPVDNEVDKSAANNKITAVIVDLSGVQFIDTTGIEFFKQSITELATLKVDLLLAACPVGIQLALKKEPTLKKFMQTNAFVSTIDALSAVQSSGFQLWQKDDNKKSASTGNKEADAKQALLSKEAESQA